MIISKYFNKAIFISGICLTVAAYFVPYILRRLLGNIIWGYREEFRLILSHLRYAGCGLGILIIILSFFYYLHQVKYLFNKILPNVLLLVISTCSFLLILEFILYNKYKDIQVGGIDSPSHFTFYRKYYQYNKWGFRDKEREHSNKSNNYRILVLGDSFTFGAGVKYINDLYPTVLEEKLNTGFPDSCRNFEVINTGLKGQSTKQEYDYLKEKGILFNPDFLILGYVLNDAETPIAKSQNVQKVESGHLLPYPFGKFLYAYSFTYYLYEPRLKRLMSQLTVSNKKPESLKNAEGIYSGENLIAYRKLFDEFMEYCNSQNLKILVVLFPSLASMNTNYAYPDMHIHSLVKEMTLENGMEFIDLFEPLKNSGIENLTVSKTDGHPSKEVHHLAAEEIYKKLLETRSITCFKKDVDG